MTVYGRSLEDVYKKLADGEQARAYEALIEIKTPKTKNYLELALAYSFFDEKAIKQGRKYLIQALKDDSLVAETADYKSLDFLYQVLEKKKLRIASSIISLLTTNNGIVSFNIARGLFLLSKYRRTIKVLEATNTDDLPDYLKSLGLSILASSYAETNNFLDAAKTYQLLVNLDNTKDYSNEKLLMAECFLQVGEAEQAIDSLDLKAKDLEEEKRLTYLRGVAFHYLNRYQESFIELKKSCLLHGQAASFELLLAMARLYIDLQENEQAISYYERTLEFAPKHHQQQIKHELARFFKAHQNFIEAKPLLKELANNMRYQHKIVAELDLAEIAFEQKDVSLAQKLVRRPYNFGLLEASILLARISMDKYDYDDAIVYLEQVLSMSKKGSFEWLSAQVLLAEVFAHKRSASPERLIMHAKNALDYLEADDEWTMTLESYLEEARAEAIENRVVN